MIAMRFAAPVLFCAILALGCSASPAGSTEEQAAVTGTYDATSVNGSPFPVLLPTTRGCAQTGLVGAVALTTAGRFTATYSYRRQCAAFTETVNRAIGGRYTVNGPNLVFAADSGFSKFATAPLVSGTIGGASITAQGQAPTGVTITIALRRR